MTMSAWPSALVEKRRNFQAASARAGSRAVIMPAAPPVGRRPLSLSMIGMAVVRRTKLLPVPLMTLRSVAVERKVMLSLPATKACWLEAALKLGMPPSLTMRSSRRRAARPSGPAKAMSLSSALSMVPPWPNSRAENIQSSPPQL